jgi:hypothetical protein
LKFNDKLDVSIWWHSRQVIWKDIGILTDYRNILYFDVGDGISARMQILLLGKIEGSDSMVWGINLNNSGRDI